jgi:type VI protein secretion system component Hcp
MEQVQIISAKVKTLAANPGGPAPVRAVEEVQLVYEKIDWAEGTQGESFLSLEFPAVFPRGEVNERQAAGD